MGADRDQTVLCRSIKENLVSLQKHLSHLQPGFFCSNTIISIFKLLLIIKKTTTTTTQNGYYTLENTQGLVESSLVYFRCQTKLYFDDIKQKENETAWTANSHPASTNPPHALPDLTSSVYFRLVTNRGTPRNSLISHQVSQSTRWSTVTF